MSAYHTPKCRNKSRRIETDAKKPAALLYSWQRGLDHVERAGLIHRMKNATQVNAAQVPTLQNKQVDALNAAHYCRTKLWSTDVDGANLRRASRGVLPSPFVGLGDLPIGSLAGSFDDFSSPGDGLGIFVRTLYGSFNLTSIRREMKYGDGLRERLIKIAQVACGPWVGIWRCIEKCVTFSHNLQR